MGVINGMSTSISRRMSAVLNGLQNEFRSLFDREEFEMKIKSLEKAEMTSDRSSKLKELFNMFDKCGIAYEKGRDNAYYQDLVRNADLPSFPEIEDRMFLALFSIYDKFPSPQDYMKEIVDRLCKEEDGWNNDTLRLRILKQFIKYGNYLADADIKGKNHIYAYVREKMSTKPNDTDILNHIDDSVFDILVFEEKSYEEIDSKERQKNIRRDKEKRKQIRRNCELLKISDDLASGKFRTEGATRKNLYLFAMVYGMSYYLRDAEGCEHVDEKTDIETNLFRNYYTNNLMRYITDAYKGRVSEYELDPSGQGINYKNFAEVIYLYYISKDCSPQDKISLSSQMIQRVQVEKYNTGKKDTKEKGGTEFYRNYIEDLLRKPEHEFEKCICEQFNCDTHYSYKTEVGKTEDSKYAPIQMEPEQVSAYNEYKEILRLIERYGGDLKDCNYGLWFTDVHSMEKNISDEVSDIDRDRFNEFKELLLRISDFIGYTDGETKTKTKALYVKSADKVTRTSLIVAYYYYYNLKHGEEKGKTFEEVFNSFKMDIDFKLDAANYQKLSGRNIFDLLVTFSSYARLNI